jgi:diguanylate cyclase (GGDEF)-like protein
VSGAQPQRRILIVDDQPANVHVLAEALREQYQLYVATSGPRAIALAAGGGVDLVLLDVMMPGMDGFEVCRRLKGDERTRKIPVIFVTALGDVDDETRGFDVGGVDYIAKPISPPVVRARVRTHLELKEARDLLEELASVDSLTGIGNRRQFDARLSNEWRRAVRTGIWLSLAILDVDDFKKFNDRYGHSKGDECLRAIALALAATCRRPSDLAARYGGEEFAFVLPETDSPGARTLMREVLGRVERLGIEHLASTCASHVSVSLGVVSLKPFEPEGATSVLEIADRLLYEAKAAGRRQGFHLDLVTGSKEALRAGEGGLGS